tara:strand:+ start:1338 stop:2204 length:867 start_codon:yes stop_codon:yes gene_type:complete
MPTKYSKNKLKQTVSSFSRDTVPNRAHEIRRDNDIIKTPKCTIEDVDWAIMSYIRDVIKPQIIENGQTIDVPIMYANGEKWAQVQARGYMRDRKGKLMTPVLSIRRGSIIERDTLKSIGVNNNPAGNDYVHRNKHTIQNKYDRFSVLQGTKPSEEYYLSPVPEFVDVSYELLLWTEYTEQMNSLVEQIMPTNGFAYGTTHKFPTYLQDVTFETTNATGEDRVVRATIPMTTKATLLMPYELRKSNFQKRYSVKKVVFGNETEGFDVNVSDEPPGGYSTKDSAVGKAKR